MPYEIKQHSAQPCDLCQQLDAETPMLIYEIGTAQHLICGNCALRISVIVSETWGEELVAAIRNYRVMDGCGDPDCQNCQGGDVGTLQ